MQRNRILGAIAVVLLFSLAGVCVAQSATLVDVDQTAAQGAFPVAADGKAAAIYVAPGNPETVRVAVQAFAADVASVTGATPKMLTSLRGPLPANLIVVGVLGKSPEIDKLVAAHKLDGSAAAGKWEAAETVTILNPPASVLPGVRMALVIAANDRRGAAYALFSISRAMGVSPWYWWADVPVAHHAAVYVRPGVHVQDSPSVEYRGIFLNDEDWGLRPWAAKKMDPAVDSAGGSGQPAKGNVGPRTYERIFELLLRLHANSLWPAMHPGSLAFNAAPENAKLADKWGIVMGSSHSEALLRNNVGEWNEAAPPKGDGPWNYQTNAAAMNSYWDKRLQENGKYENFYTVGLRGVHDSGLEATGTPEVKAKLVEDVMTAQRKLLAARVNGDVTKIPQVIWVYKESLDLYRVGMKVPDDVTLGWTDDNYGYIRELPNAAEQKRAGGSGVYYHVSYWGAPHDYLWLCTTPPSLIREEMTKAFDHNARRYWILNVGDLKPAEIDIDYFMQLATDEPRVAKMGQREWLTQWFAEQFPTLADGKLFDPATWVFTNDFRVSGRLGADLDLYYQLNFVRKPEFMGFNGYNDGAKRTEFNPLAWGQSILTVDHVTPAQGSPDLMLPTGPTHSYPDQNRFRAAQWSFLVKDEQNVGKVLPPEYASAFFELVGYPIEGAAAMNEKFLATDLTYLDVATGKDAAALKMDSDRAHAAYDAIQTLTLKYNSIEGGKWDGMMSAAPRERHVFEMPRTATTADATTPLPASWGADDSPVVEHPVAPPPGFHEEHFAVSMNAASFTRKSGAGPAQWNVLDDLGISGASMEYGAPGLLANRPETAFHAGGDSSTSFAVDPPWLEYEFTTTSSGAATLAVHLLPTFAVDSEHHLRFFVALDGKMVSGTLDLSGTNGHGPDTATWSANVLRNSAVEMVPLGPLAPGKHTLRVTALDPGVVFEHLVVTFAGAPPAYPVPPETR